jgi:hypothetical protein
MRGVGHAALLRCRRRTAPRPHLCHAKAYFQGRAGGKTWLVPDAFYRLRQLDGRADLAARFLNFVSGDDDFRETPVVGFGSIGSRGIVA